MSDNAFEIAQRLESRANGLRYRDSRLKGYLDAARYYFAASKFQDAERCLGQIINFNHSVTTARPLFYNEAVFLLSEILKVKSIRHSNPTEMEQALKLLKDNLLKLKSGEVGYKRRFCMEILSIAVLYRQIFRSDLLSPDPKHADSYYYYYDCATRLYNHYETGFADNYIALRSMLLYGDYKAAIGDNATAVREYTKVAAFVKLYSSRELNDTERNLAGQYVNLSLVNVAVSAAKLIGRGGQFNPAFLGFLEAKAYFGMAGIFARKANSMSGEQKKQNTIYSMGNLAKALSILLKIKSDSRADFWSPGKWEERQLYFFVLASYAERLMSYHMLTNNNNSLNLAKKYAAEIRDWHAKSGEDLIRGPFERILALGL